MHTFRPSMIARLLRDSTPVAWRAVAKDGMDLPARSRDDAAARCSRWATARRTTSSSRRRSPADLKLVVTSAVGVRLAEMPVVVR